MELIVASIIGVLVAGATTTSLSRLLRVRADSESRRAAFARAEAAASRVALDVQTVARDSDLLNARVLVTDSERSDLPRDELLLFCRSMRRARGMDEYAEGTDFEVQYRLAEHDGTPALWRRVDPVPDKVPGGGGVATPIVHGVVSLSVEAYNGQNWTTFWDSDYDGYPHALRVTITAESDDGTKSATARRVVALDRVPLPAAGAQGATLDFGSLTTGGGQ